MATLNPRGLIPGVPVQNGGVPDTLNRAPGPIEQGTEPWLTTTRFTAPPFSKPVWRERDQRGIVRDVTVCGICQRLWRPELGPICTECRKARRRAKIARRKGKRVAA